MMIAKTIMVYQAHVKSVVLVPGVRGCSAATAEPLENVIYLSKFMPHFTTDHVIILPHSQEYQQLYGITAKDILLTLNEPEMKEGLPEGRYTVEKNIGDRRIYVYYYITLPLQSRDSQVYAVVDFVGFTAKMG